jgi:hypothetical protein
MPTTICHPGKLDSELKLTTKRETKAQEEHFMIRKEFLKGIVAALFLLVCGLPFAPPAQAKGLASKTNSKQKLNKVDRVLSNNSYRPMDINNIYNYYGNNGDGSFNKFSTSNEGFEFPIGSPSGTAIFEDGLVWTAFKNDTLLCGGSTYNHGLQAGPITSYGTATKLPTAADPGNTSYRVYRVRPDIRPTTNADTIALETNILTNSELTYVNQYESYSANDLLQQYWNDWNQWPADQGAPYTDVNHDGKYEPGIDIPGFPGADQTEWMVMNDVNPTLTLGLYGSNPIGIEVQRTIWAYNRPGALGNTIFISYKFINKSGVALDSMYVSQWADPDLGYAGDDAVGSDTTRSLGYVYNGEASDANYASLGLPPPAVGFDFFQGPKVPGAASDTAIFNMQYVPGYKNLPMTAFDFFINGNATFVDPNLDDPTGTPQWYNLMRGLVSSSGQPFPATVTGGSNFSYPGDPVTGTGPTFIGSAAVSAPADVRMCLCSGPFNMAPGDTQQVVVAALVGLGADYLSSISVLRANDDIAQSAYNALFQLAVPPPQPVVHVAQLNNQIVLSWGSPVAADNTENFVSKGYTFEGYNVYQYQRNNPSGGKLIATYDLIDGVRTILDTTFSVALGTNIVTPTEYGTDSGIRHSITITKDAFSGSPLVNDRDYYFAVTAYSYNPTEGLVPHALESSPSILDVRPQSPPNGVRYSANAGDSLMVTHSAGNSNGEVVATVVDPSQLTGDSYQVGFDSTGAWNLTDTKTNKLIVSGLQQTITGNNSPGVVNSGVLIQTYGPPAGINSFTYTGDRWITGVNWGGGAFFGGADIGANFFGSDLPNSDYVPVEIKFDSMSAVGSAGWSQGAVYRRDLGYAYAGIGWMPFTVWDISNPAKPRQINACFVEDSVAGNANMQWDMGWNGTSFAADGGREYIFINYTSYNPSDYNNTTTGYDHDVLYAIWPAGRGTQTYLEGSFTITIVPNYPNTPADKFTFKTIAPTDSSKNQIADLAKINVFPNPYFGFNRLETDKYTRWVRFTHLPNKATIRIFNLAGILVRTLVKNDNTQFMDWDLMNENQLPVAAGMYIAQITTPIGSRTLKLAIIPEQQFLDHY